MNENRLTPIQISLSIHLSILLVGASGYLFRLFKFSSQQIVPLTVIEEPMVVPANLVLQPPKDLPRPEVKPAPVDTQKVFGVSRKAITAAAGDDTGIKIKNGNTVVKEQDDLLLKDSDADSIPIPSDDFLITQNAKLIFSPKLSRTDEAKKEGYTGTAELNLVIDQKGIVRDVKLLNDLKFGLNEKAIEIARQLRFQPAQIQGEAVAVKVRFNLNFKASN